jgi:cephalosporin hydroxylase
MNVRVAFPALLVVVLAACQPSTASPSVPANLRSAYLELDEAEQEIVRRFALLFARTEDTFWCNRWLGIPTVQHPYDVWVTQEIITEVVPDVIVETGTARGGSAALWAMILAQVNPKGRVITIDIRDGTAQARELPVFRERVEFLHGSSVAPEIVSAVEERTKGKRVMVILDSDHSKEHVLKELAAYAPLIEVGSYLIVQDTGGVMGLKPNPGPRRAVVEFLAGDDRFESDRSRERMLFTMHPEGYLRRVR